MKAKFRGDTVGAWSSGTRSQEPGARNQEPGTRSQSASHHQPSLKSRSHHFSCTVSRYSQLMWTSRVLSYIPWYHSHYWALLWYKGHNGDVKGRCVCGGTDNGNQGNNTCEMWAIVTVVSLDCRAEPFTAATVESPFIRAWMRPPHTHTHTTTHNNNTHNPTWLRPKHKASDACIQPPCPNPNVQNHHTHTSTERCKSVCVCVCVCVCVYCCFI